MAGRLANREHVVMTGAAVIHDACMIKRCRYEARGDVAHIAIIVGRYMIRWWGFASGGYAIVARFTVANDALVIEPGTGKGRGDMTHGAILRRWKMVLRQAGRGYTIVARRAIIDDTGMIEHRRYKGAAGYVADVAVLICRHMRWIDLGILTGGIDTIVAGITPLTHYCGPGMIYKCTEEAGRVMAHGTIPACVAMNRGIWFSNSPEQLMIQTAIMTRGAIAGDSRVGKNRGCESSNRVTAVTVLGCR